MGDLDKYKRKAKLKVVAMDTLHVGVSAVIKIVKVTLVMVPAYLGVMMSALVLEDVVGIPLFEGVFVVVMLLCFIGIVYSMLYSFWSNIDENRVTKEAKKMWAEDKFKHEAKTSELTGALSKPEVNGELTVIRKKP